MHNGMARETSETCGNGETRRWVNAPTLDCHESEEYRMPVGGAITPRGNMVHKGIERWDGEQARFNREA
jgi:hypothetical protein